MSMIKSFLKNESGATAAEYALLLIIVVAAAATGLKLVGTALSTSLSNGATTI